MAFKTIAEFTTGEVTANGLNNFTSGNPLSAATLMKSLLDLLQGLRYTGLSGVLSGGVCTAATNIVTVPAGTVYLAGGVVWENSSGAVTKAVADGTLYLWGQSNGQLDVSASASVPPSGYENGKAALLCKTVTVAGVTTVDNTVQHKTRVPDHTNRYVSEPGIKGSGGGQRRGRAAVSFASDANKTLSQAEYECETIDIGSGTALTATRNLVFPLTDSAKWFVNNQSTGGQSVQCIGATGTGVTIATAKGAWVWCNGADIKRMSADVTV